MPRPRKFATNADRQKAYRKRHRSVNIVTKRRGRPRKWCCANARAYASWNRTNGRSWMEGDREIVASRSYARGHKCIKPIEQRLKELEEWQESRSGL